MEGTSRLRGMLENQIPCLKNGATMNVALSSGEKRNQAHTECVDFGILCVPTSLKSIWHIPVNIKLWTQPIFLLYLLEYNQHPDHRSSTVRLATSDAIHRVIVLYNLLKPTSPPASLGFEFRVMVKWWSTIFWMTIKGFIVIKMQYGPVAFTYFYPSI